MCLPCSKQAFQSKSEFSQQQSFYSNMVTNQQIVTMSQAQQNISDVSNHLSPIL